MTKLTFATEGNHFLRNGAPHRIFSGALYYFRVPAACWEDRILKCRACGLNTIETYVAWNLHEPRQGTFCFEGDLDIRRFVQLAGHHGLDVILRPGPYICSEWDLGGLPSWLLADAGMQLRTMHPGYLSAAEGYLDQLMAQVGDLQCEQGGPIIAMQVENEYGSFGNNQEYLRWTEEALRRRHVSTLLFTSDGAEDAMLQGGTLPHLLKTVNFGSRAGEAFAKLREYQKEGPLMCMEFWNSWFSHWGEPRNPRTPADSAQALREILEADGSVNIYMMHGGTNFGFLNGANFDRTYQSTVTSYDLDAPLNERGEPTERYFLFREAFASHGAKIEEVPPTAPARAYGTIALTEHCSLFDLPGALIPPIPSLETKTMEEVGQNYGYILYRTRVSGPRPASQLSIQEVRDRAYVFLDGIFQGIIDRNDLNKTLTIVVPPDGARLDILVENLGRINYGAELHDRKGITRGVRLTQQFLSNWEIFPMDFSRLPTLPWKNNAIAEVPAFFLGRFSIPEVADTFLRVEGAHGAAWINGTCLGRYWNIGPQRSLYVPATLLKKGENSLVVLELENGKPEAHLEEHSKWA